MSEQNDLTLEGFLCNSNLLSLDLPSLKRIDLCQCRLTRIEKKLFSNLPNLESLNLSYNELIEVDKNLFKNLTALKILNLSQNNITK
jgi:Leucine-rich repeat (LRR) protein